MSAVMQPLQDGLRLMTDDDIDGVMQLETAVYEFPWTKGIFRDCLRVGYCCWVYQEEGEIRAYGVMSVAAEEAHILTLVVAPHYQGCGLGTMMLANLLQVAKRHAAREVFLEVRPSNEAAIALYEKTGFRIIGQRPGYYPDKHGREDAIIMALTLPVSK